MDGVPQQNNPNLVKHAGYTLRGKLAYREHAIVHLNVVLTSLKGRGSGGGGRGAGGKFCDFLSASMDKEALYNWALLFMEKNLS